jgi:hypothetical protein
MQVKSFLTGKSFSIDRNINAQAMDTHGEKVAKTLMDAQKKKKKMTVCVTLDEIRCSSARRVRKPRLAFQQT